MVDLDLDRIDYGTLLLPGSMTPGMGVPFADKLGHFGFYSILSFLALHGYRDRIPVVFILTGIIAYSICIRRIAAMAVCRKAF